jgi:plasmid stabilization system protein ParE
MPGGSGPSVPAVLFTPRATRELLAAVTWWRKNRLEAPRLLDDEIERALRRIAVFPRSAPVVRGRDARRVLLRRSGYRLFYRVRPRLGRIEVISVSHGRRG